MEKLQQFQTARLVLLDEHDRLLMPIRPLNSKQRPGELDFFGGMVELGECPMMAAVRETDEEADLKVDIASVTDLYEQTDIDGSKEIERKYYRGRNKVSANQIKHLSEHIALACVSVETALEVVTFIPHQRAIIQLALHQ